MATPPSPPPPAPPKPTPEEKATKDPLFGNVLNELNVDADQLKKRQALIADIEKLLSAKYGAKNRLISYIVRFGHPHALMLTADIPSIEAMLNSISGAEQLNVILHSPGGDGTIVEKIVYMCRSHLSGNKQKLRIIVPNLAKSAATVMALGADTIIMGYSSEIGPIDPQVQITVSGSNQWLSALSFVESRNILMKQIDEATKQKKTTVGLLTQLAGLNIPFIQEMDHQIDFAKKTAARLLEKYMLKPKYPSRDSRLRKANKIAEKLLSKKLFPIHGQFIDGATAKKELQLDVEVLDMKDALWVKIWEYYLRCEIQMLVQRPNTPAKLKLFESSRASLTVQGS